MQNCSVYVTFLCTIRTPNFEPKAWSRYITIGYESKVHEATKCTQSIVIGEVGAIVIGDTTQGNLATVA